jgi:ribonuclease D
MMTIHLHEHDLPADLTLGAEIAVDSETMGLRPARDRLCLVQLSAGDGVVHLVRLGVGHAPAPNLAQVLKLIHYARFDVAMFLRHLGVLCAPVYCTKIASRLARTYTDRHGLKDLVRELLGIELSKTEQSSDWGAAELSEAQLRYAAADVLHLHAVKTKLDLMLAREGRTELAASCFAFVPTRAQLDLAGWDDQDIFAH